MGMMKKLVTFKADESPEAVRERIRVRKAGEQAHADTLSKFGAFNPDNADEAIKFQEARIKYYLSLPIE